jgi:perosamine synthetase
MSAVPITKPSIGEEEIAAVRDVLLSGWLSQGPRVQEFERVVAGYVGAEQAVATSNCTTALHLALIAAGVRKGDEVICPSFSFIATANAIVYAGAEPVFVDIDPLTYNIDPEQVEAAITSRTRAIMPVDQIGLAADIPTILDIARRHGLSVVEDAAPSLGAGVGGSRVGSLSDFTCFSFHPRKSITTGEGGMVTTSDAEAAVQLRRIRSHGASTSDLARHQSGSIEFEEYAELGFNYRMTDIQAAIGLVQMRRLDGILAERQRLALRYGELLATVDGVGLPHQPPERPHTFQSYCIRVPDGTRAQVMADLGQAGIASRRGVMAIHLEPLYRSLHPRLSLPVTERATVETMLLPLYVGMGEADQERIAEVVASSLRRRRAA